MYNGYSDYRQLGSDGMSAFGIVLLWSLAVLFIGFLVIYAIIVFIFGDPVESDEGDNDGTS